MGFADLFNTFDGLPRSSGTLKTVIPTHIRSEIKMLMINSGRKTASVLGHNRIILSNNQWNDGYVSEFVVFFIDFWSPPKYSLVVLPGMLLSPGTDKRPWSRWLPLDTCWTVLYVSDTEAPPHSHLLLIYRWTKQRKESRPSKRLWGGLLVPVNAFNRYGDRTQNQNFTLGRRRGGMGGVGGRWWVSCFPGKVRIQT